MCVEVGCFGKAAHFVVYVCVWRVLKGDWWCSVYFVLIFKIMMGVF